MKIKNKKKLLTLCCSSLLTLSAYADGFIVRDIKVNGLKRVSLGTVLNYLPVEVGEEVTSSSTPQIIRSLYETGFFQSVVLERTGNTLIIQVIERPTIGSITLVGNKDLPSDKMKEILKELGLVKGRVFQRSALERLEKELKQAYNARGKYNARVETSIANLTENRVGININISEGRVSRIKEIKIIGNQDFKESDLLPEMALAKSNIYTYFTKKDQYSQAAMDASLESLRSYYLDRGYLKFKIVSSQVLLAPDKKDVFINVHIDEGPQYHFSGFEIAGKTVLPEKKLNSLVKIKAGEVFSRKKVTQTISDIGLALGDKGFGFPAIHAEPNINEKDKTVFITFIIDQGRHVYVRRINFIGNIKTADYVLRNIIRQNEGALLSLHNIKESERQLRLLSYLKNINIKTTPIPGVNNQVDLDVTVEEASSAEASASIGYGSTGYQMNASFNQYNFLGTGRTVGLSASSSLWGQDYSFNYYNPFYTNTGVGRGLSLYFQKVDPKHLDVSSYSSDRFGGEISYSLRIGEASSAQLGYGFQSLNIQSVGRVRQIQNFVNEHGRDFNELRLNAGWNHNTYDQMPFPTRGMNQQATGMVAVPITKNSLSYYKTGYQAHTYYPLIGGFIFTALGNVSYGNMFDGEGLPFFENYFAGGIAQPGQVRGYNNYSLGPQDNHGNSLGGNLLTNASIGVILPYPLARENIRTTVFADAGNVFAIGTPVALRGTPAGPLRYSVGLSVDWRSPFGPLAFSVAKALNRQPLDGIEVFQFSMSSSF